MKTNIKKQLISSVHRKITFWRKFCFKRSLKRVKKEIKEIRDAAKVDTSKLHQKFY